MDENKLAKWLEEEYSKDASGQNSELAKHINVLDDLSIPEVNADALYDNILNRVQTKPVTKTFSLLRWVASSAAFLAIAIGAYFVLSNQNHVVTADQYVVNHTLPDQSKFTLKGNSEIEYSKDFNNRVLTLDGEAFFEVEKGSTFSVKTSNGVVEVLGTSFNVFSREGYLMVDCKTGKVKVSSDNQSTILTPGKRVIINGSELTNEDVSIEGIDAWTTGESSFESVPLSIVILSIEEQFGLAINTNAIDTDALFTGSYLNSDLDKSLKMVFAPMGIEFEKINDKSIELSK